jgi:hypothetical protein
LQFFATVFAALMLATTTMASPVAEAHDANAPMERVEGPEGRSVLINYLTRRAKMVETGPVQYCAGLCPDGIHGCGGATYCPNKAKCTEYCD